MKPKNYREKQEVIMGVSMKKVIGSLFLLFAMFPLSAKEQGLLNSFFGSLIKGSLYPEIKSCYVFGAQQYSQELNKSKRDQYARHFKGLYEQALNGECANIPLLNHISWSVAHNFVYLGIQPSDFLKGSVETLCNYLKSETNQINREKSYLNSLERLDCAALYHYADQKTKESIRKMALLMQDDLLLKDITLPFSAGFPSKQFAEILQSIKLELKERDRQIEHERQIEHKRQIEMLQSQLWAEFENNGQSELAQELLERLEQLQKLNQGEVS